ncbi:MAG: Gfo/Idh/MocA family oxidoreductase [Acidobacteriota bacterium]|nr:Gfo/Idh/MocA family oxidoreductase [Acidobacteriota bacterium]
MPSTRRNFLQNTAFQTSAAALMQAGTGRTISANDKIRVATIGHGGMGSGDTRSALSIPGVELVGVSDIYDGRLARVKELYGDQIFTTRDYREILNRKDIDCVIIATPDHWHSAISIAAMEAGKDVYCEKPMVHNIAEGKPVIDAQERTGRMFQVGSQYVTSLVFQKAKEMMSGGEIGKLNMVEAWLDRNTAIGAWEYSIPPDASPANIDWDRFLGGAPKRAFDPVRMFRWRNYRDYGTGVAGDLFVHLLSGLHVVTGSQGPDRVMATGGLRYWKDGRDVPDVMLAMLDYPAQTAHPEFTLSLRVNFKSGVPREQVGFRFIGSGGTMTVSMSSLVLERTPPEAEPGYTIGTFAKKVQEEFLREYRRKYPETRPTADGMRPESELRFAPPAGYDAHREHMRVFLDAVRSRKRPVEDATFGLRAAGPALLTNVSYFEKRICRWDAQKLIAS